MNDSFNLIEDIILRYGSRGMELVRNNLPNGYCKRSAELIDSAAKGTILIGTGFPAAGSFETDGPIGAIALYKVLKILGCKPVFVFAPPIFNAFRNHFDVYEFPILPWEESIPFVKSALAKLDPSLVISIERAGITADGHYYNMHKKDITKLVSKYDLFLNLSGSPSIGIGDGGNEIGMGNVTDALEKLDIIPSITKCTELVIASVSNWGAYGIIAALSLLHKKDLFTCFNTLEIMDFLITSGSVDGTNFRAEYTEDGHSLKVGEEIIKNLRSVIFEFIC